MTKYSVLLVDDEEDVIQVIIRRISWEALGFEVMGYAHNGLEALELAEERQPDVVMTDIKMPYMDGLTLSKRLKELYPTVKIIIFSGFDEFEYAKEAIRLEAEEYILKPINAEELGEVFGRIHAALDREFDEKQNINMLKNYYLESLPILKENLYTALIEGRVPEQDIPHEMMDCQVSLDGPYYTVALLHNSQSLSPQGINPVLITMSIRKAAEERLSARWNARFFTYLGDIVVIAQLKRQEELTELTDSCEMLCRIARHVCNATVSAGIGRAVSELRLLPQSFAGANEALSYRVIYGRGKAISISEIAPEEHSADERCDENAVLYRTETLQELFRSIRMDSEEALEGKIERYLSQSVPKNPSIQDYHFFLMELVTELYRFLHSSHVEPERIFPQDEDVYRMVQQMDLRELSAWLKRSCVLAQQRIQENRQDSTKSFVRRAIEYVGRNYSDQDLNVEHICGYLHVSAAYFSTVFKRETGKTFINYLTDFRMERAVRMLMEEDEKTYIIAEAVGYSDPNYFSYAFKKKFGMSPSKYKQSQGV